MANDSAQCKAYFCTSQIEAHACILYSVIGGSTTVGQWARVEGTPTVVNPNDPLAHVTNPP